MSNSFSCINCGVVACDETGKSFPTACISKQADQVLIDEALKEYDDPKVNNFFIQAANVEYEGYGVMTRVEETIALAKKLGAKKIGIATCIGLLNESKMLMKLLKHHGFEVYGVGCKLGGIPKEQVGIPKACNEVGVNMCNPILQAKTLNKEKTDLNILMGLCVGHDSLFYKYSDAFVTTLVVKDRVMGHNPVNVLYQLNDYYSKLFT